MRKQWLAQVTRIVVKLGTGVLTDDDKQPSRARMRLLVRQVARLHAAGKEVVLVTSGAVGAGMGALGYRTRPSVLAELQACAAIGQSRLMATYQALFAKHGLHTAQVLLTHDDLEHHERHLNARNTLVTLLRHKVVPIINENDTVSFAEIKFGDNDRLSALVASLLPADLLVILTTVEGLMENFGSPDAQVIPVVHSIGEAVERLAGGTTSATAVGGMASKIQAAKIVVRAGIPLVIAAGARREALRDIVAGKPVGTLFVPSPNKLRGRKRWIAFFHHPKGTVFVDEGARKALREGGKSLLRPGVTGSDGQFQKGEIVRVCDRDGTEFARGIAALSSTQLRSAERLQGEAIHRDDLVVW